MRINDYRWLPVLFALALAGCSDDPGTGPIKPRWDRDPCERCGMVLSDRHYAAQIRYFPEGKKYSRVARFDDIGCATLWLADKPWREDPRVEIWVADYRTGEWLDARKAVYVEGRVTPMAYGLGAQKGPLEGALSFEQAKQHIRAVEERFNVRDAHLLERARAQSESRQAHAEDDNDLPPIVKSKN